MTRARRPIALLTLGGLFLAVGTPLYAVITVPYLSGNLLNPTVLVWQAVPYVLCALLWLPWREAAAARTGVVLAVALFVCALILYIPLLVRPTLLSSDMAGVVLVFVSAGTAVLLLVASAIAWLGPRLRAGSRAG